MPGVWFQGSGFGSQAWGPLLPEWQCGIEGDSVGCASGLQRFEPWFCHLLSGPGQAAELFCASVSKTGMVIIIALSLVCGENDVK